MDEPEGSNSIELNEVAAATTPVIARRRRRRGLIGLIQNLILLVSLVLLIALILSLVRIPIRMAKRKGHPELERIKTYAYLGMAFPPLWIMAYVMASGSGGSRTADSKAGP